MQFQDFQQNQEDDEEDLKLFSQQKRNSFLEQSKKNVLFDILKLGKTQVAVSFKQSVQKVQEKQSQENQQKYSSQIKKEKIFQRQLVFQRFGGGNKSLNQSLIKEKPNNTIYNEKNFQQNNSMIYFNKNDSQQNQKGSQTQRVSQGPRELDYLKRKKNQILNNEELNSSFWNGSQKVQELDDKKLIQLYQNGLFSRLPMKHNAQNPNLVLLKFRKNFQRYQQEEKNRKEFDVLKVRSAALSDLNKIQQTAGNKFRVVDCYQNSPKKNVNSQQSPSRKEFQTQSLNQSVLLNEEGSQAIKKNRSNQNLKKNSHQNNNSSTQNVNFAISPEKESIFQVESNKNNKSYQEILIQNQNCSKFYDQKEKNLENNRNQTEFKIKDLQKWKEELDALNSNGSKEIIQNDFIKFPLKRRNNESLQDNLRQAQNNEIQNFNYNNNNFSIGADQKFCLDSEGFFKTNVNFINQKNFAKNEKKQHFAQRSTCYEDFKSKDQFKQIPFRNKLILQKIFAPKNNSKQHSQSFHQCDDINSILIDNSLQEVYKSAFQSKQIHLQKNDSIEREINKKQKEFLIDKIIQNSKYPKGEKNFYKILKRKQNVQNNITNKINQINSSQNNKNRPENHNILNKKPENITSIDPWQQNIDYEFDDPLDQHQMTSNKI